MSVIHAPQEPRVGIRQILVPVTLLIVFIIYFARLWYIQVAAAPQLRAQALRTSIVEEPILAPRGVIVDRDGDLIAGLRTAWVVTGIPKVAADHPEALEHTASILGIEPADIQKRLDDAYRTKNLPTVVYIGATLEQATRIAEAKSDLPGFGVTTRALRSMDHVEGFSHLLGYVGIPNDAVDRRLKEMNVKIPDFAGRDGIEWEYELALMGVEGYQKMVVDAQERPVRQHPGLLPTPGSQLTLSVERDLQVLAQNMLAETLTGRGAVVAIEPQTGEVLCLVSGPDYDLKLFDGGISSDNYKMLSEAEGRPLFKRSIAGEYPPGSTFKIATALAAMKKGKLSLSRTILCNGVYQLGQRPIRCANHPPGERITFLRAIEKSCNSYFVQLGIDLGAEALTEAAHSLHLGEKTGIDIAGETEGKVPTPDDIRKLSDERKWFTGDTANIAIGQGALAVTPIQMATMMALVANEGKAYRPHLLKSVQPVGGESVPTTPIQNAEVDAPVQFWSDIKTALNRVVSPTGTAWRAVIPGLEWAGKTGSAEHRRGEETHGWFVGFAPVDDPQIAIVVIVEASGHGGEVAAPIAKEIVQLHLFGPPQASEGESSASASENSLTAADPSDGSAPSVEISSSAADRP